MKTAEEVLVGQILRERFGVEDESVASRLLAGPICEGDVLLLAKVDMARREEARATDPRWAGAN